ncbi:MAG: 2-oxoacid:acceptor oxidoreductase family protein [Candidatus Krumholzibacteria bacterium]|nr:2-oxoacid:acceptor oxidoreductase family protein [Candidatus Krumholzibacteria bacterium]
MTTTSAFFQHFDRHAHGKGLKGSTTHYCPGCGHGLVHKYLANTIAELGIEDRTIAISPVGCAVFLYYYFDVGNTQAAHGRAPAVALGHKLANPESIVISYQGDGDLAAIGLSEIMHAAQLGVPISVIFINNAIYGMTGGQMAPTTLMGQSSTTTPTGRGTMQGEPLKVSELISQLDGPIYVERTALFDQKTRRRTQRAIKKAIQLQIENRGFGFVEVLSECPVHWGMTPVEAETWVREHLVPVFPLGVLKDEDVEPWFGLEKPDFDPDRMIEVLDASTEAPASFTNDFPSHLDAADVALKFAGAGGDGAQTAALLLTKAAINEGFDATHIPSYGPESRGGTSYADVHVARDEVLSPAASKPHVLVAFNAPSLNKFGAEVAENGIVIYDSSVISEQPKFQKGVRVYPVPCAKIARSLGQIVVKNVVALGALQEASHVLAEDSFLTAIRLSLRDKCAMIPVNEEAFRWGVKAIRDNITDLD